jgi:hypothetical protein
MFVLILYIEILRSTTTVVREDEVADERREVCLLSHAHALGDVAHHDARTLDVRHLVVRIDTCLVLGEEHGVLHLTYVVIQSTGTHEERVGTYLIGYLCCEVAHGDRVLERTGSHLRRSSATSSSRTTVVVLRSISI